MDLTVFIIIILASVVVLAFLLKDFLRKKKSIEIMVFGILFVLTGGFLLMQTIIPDYTIFISGFGLIIFGFFAGVLGFIKN